MFSSQSNLLEKLKFEDKKNFKIEYPSKLKIESFLEELWLSNGFIGVSWDDLIKKVKNQFFELNNASKSTLYRFLKNSFNIKLLKPKMK